MSFVETCTSNYSAATLQPCIGSGSPKESCRQAQKRLRFTGVHRRNRFDCIVTVVARGSKLNSFQVFQEKSLRPLPDPMVRSP